MAGGFAGDDEDFENYENDELEEIEETEDEEENESSDGDSNDDEEDLDDDEESDEDEEDSDDGESKKGGRKSLKERRKEEKEKKKKEVQAYLKRVNKKLDKFNQKINDIIMPSLDAGMPNPQALQASKELNDIKQDVKTLPKLAEFDKSVRQETPNIIKKFGKSAVDSVKAVGKFFTNLASVIVPILVPAFLVILVGILIIAVIVAFSVLFPWFFKETAGNSAIPISGMTGNDFYGMRTWYRDTELARTEMKNQYIDLANGQINLEENGKYIVTLEGGATVTISLIEDKETIEENLNNYLNEIATEMFKIDNPGESIPTNLDDKLDGIKYFGIAMDNLATIKPLIERYVRDNYNFAVSDGSEFDKDTWVSENIDLTTDSAIGFRTEKVFVRDYIIEGSDANITGIERADYIGFTVMAKRDLTITSMLMNTVYMAEDFDMSIICNGVDMGASHIETIQQGDITQYNYEMVGNASVSQYDYQSLEIEEGEKSVSLYDLAVDGSTLVVAVDGIYSFNTGDGFVGLFTNPGGETFLINESETYWN